MEKYIRVGQKLSSININGISISNFSIYIPSYGAFKGPSNAPEWIKKASRILQSYIFKLTNVHLPIYMDSYPLRSKGNIFIGDCFLDGAKKNNYEDDEYFFEIEGSSIYFNGGKRGIQYGIYTFLEKHLGFRFFSSDVEKILYKRNIRLVDLKERYNPPFEYREICDPNIWDASFSVKSKINGNFVRKLKEEDGYSVGFAGGFDGLVHTFSKLVNPSKYYENNKDLYAFDGKIRNPNGLCLTNLETIEVISKEAIKWLDKEKDPTLLSISINDANMTYCRCPACQKKLEEGYNDTDLYLDFVNKVSNKIHETYPKVKVEALIYQHTVILPNIIKPNEDIVIRYCPPAVRKMPIKEAGELYLKTKDPLLETSYQTLKTLEQWSKISKKLYIWDYPCNYFSSNVIFPIWSTLLDNMRFFYDHHAKGIYINGQGDYASFNELTTYLLSKIMFNPLMDKKEYETHVASFLEGYYGEGYKYVKEYMDLSIKLSKPYFTSFASPLEIIPTEYSSIYITKGNELLDKAIKLAKGSGEKDRIKKLKLTILYYDVLINQKKAYQGKDKKLINEYINKYKKLYKESIRLGIVRISENVFLPVVKNFAQPIEETFFWEMKGKAYQDRNNENYPRKMYILIPVDGELGETKEIEILCKTNNENINGYINTYIDGKFVSSKINPRWNKDLEYKKIRLKGSITNASNISRQFNMPLDGLYLCYVPTEQKGIFVEMNEMDPGAYITFKEIEREKENA